MPKDDRLRFLFAQAFEEAMPTDDCIPADRLLAAAQGELDPEARDAVIDHTTRCPVCAEAWRLAWLPQDETP
ncbi:MAG: hypothetical protein ACI8PZ_001841 [Myxococcota bacterium]|jgi:hypothetical protein